MWNLFPKYIMINVNILKQTEIYNGCENFKHVKLKIM